MVSLTETVVVRKSVNVLNIPTIPIHNMTQQGLWALACFDGEWTLLLFSNFETLLLLLHIKIRRPHFSGWGTRHLSTWRHKCPKRTNGNTLTEPKVLPRRLGNPPTQAALTGGLLGLTLGLPLALHYGLLLGLFMGWHGAGVPAVRNWKWCHSKVNAFLTRSPSFKRQ